MIYRLVEADEVVARLDNDFNANSGDWINRVPQWIHQCLSDLKIYLGLLPKSHVANVTNYYTDIPTDVKRLIGIEYNGCRLDRRATSMYKDQIIDNPSYATLITNIGTTITGTITNATLDDDLQDLQINVEKIRTYDATTINELPSSDHYYYLHPNGKIETSFVTGIVIFHYYILPASYNERLNSLCPLIPDNELVKDAIAWFLFQMILQRGVSHPVFKLGHSNPVLDPFRRYKDARLKAKNNASEDDADNAKIINRMWQSALYNVIANER